jgi:hypothetical protein
LLGGEKDKANLPQDVLDGDVLATAVFQEEFVVPPDSQRLHPVDVAPVPPSPILKCSPFEQ